MKIKINFFVFILVMNVFWISNLSPMVMMSSATLVDPHHMIKPYKDDQVQVFDLHSGKILAILPIKYDTTDREAISFDGKYLLTSSGKKAKIWDINPESNTNGEELNSFTGHTDKITALAFSHEGDIIATGSKDRNIRIWDVGTGNCLKVIQDFDSPVNYVEFSPDDKLMLTETDNGTLQLFVVSSGECIFKDKNLKPDDTVKFAKDGKNIVLTSEDGEEKTVNIEEYIKNLEKKSYKKEKDTEYDILFKYEENQGKNKVL